MSDTPTYKEQREAVERMADKIASSQNISHDQARAIAVRAATIHDRNKRQ